MRRALLPIFAALLPALLLACENRPPEVAPAPPPRPPATATASAQPAAPAETPDADFRKEAPKPGPDVVFVPPRIEEAKLSNGIRVLFVERHELPIVAVRVVSSLGASQAPPGVGAFAGAMFLAGTKKRSALQISDEFQALGAEHGAYVDYDASTVYAQVLSNRFGEALELLADVAQHPSFPKDELKRERSKRLTSLQQEKDSPQRLLSIAVGEALYPATHPYRSSLLGGEAAINKVSAADLEGFHRAAFEPDRLTITASGDVTRAQLIEQLEKAFGGWKGKAAKAKTPADPPAPGGDAPRVVILDRPGASQTNVSVAMVGVPRASKDYDALLLMNTILGGQFSSRLNLNLREKHGYTYGAGSSFAMRQGSGPFSAGGAIVREHTAPAIKEIFSELDAIRSAAVSDEELDNAKANLIKRLPALFETVGDTTSTLAALATYGLPLDEYATRPARIEKLTKDDIKRVASTYLKPEQMRVVMVGDAAAIKGPVTELNLGKVEVRDAGGKGGDKKADQKGDKAQGDKKGERPKGDVPQAPGPKGGKKGKLSPQVFPNENGISREPPG